MSIEPDVALPVQPNRLIGREAICAHVGDLVLAEHHRLVTLIGPGGVGKTRLAMCLAEDLAANFPDGTWFVPLEHLRTSELVMPAIARTMGVHEALGQVGLDLLITTLRDRRALLVLDNLEQVAGAASEIAQLLAGCKYLRILGTSRASLRLRAEREVPVEPLDTPAAGSVVAAADIAESAAVELFVERARAVRPTFNLSNFTAPIIAEICRRLDGLPLAIELAASTINVLSPQELLDRLNNRLQLLSNGAVDLPARQRSLRSAIAWSHDLLDANERRLFESLSVFAGEFGIEAAAVLLDENDETGGDSDVLPTLSSLVDKSLLNRIDVPDGEVRFRMLSTIKEFGLERLADSGDLVVAQHRLVAWALDLAERAAPELTGPEQARWLSILEREHDNLRAALIVARDVSPEEGLRVASALWRFWATRGYLTEGCSWLEQYVAASDGIEDRYLARALVSLGNLALDLGAYEDAIVSYDHGLRLFEKLGDQWGVADALNGTGLVDWYRGENLKARDAHEQSLAIRRELGNRQGEANSLSNLANAVRDLGEIELAGELHRQALQIRMSRGDRGATGFSLVNLGDISWRLGRADEAQSFFQQSLDTFREVHDMLGEAYALLGIGLAAAMANDAGEARRSIADSLAIRLRLGDRRGVIECVEGIAALAARGRQESKAARLFGAAQALRRQIDAPLAEADRERQARLVAKLRPALADSAFRQEWDAGAALTMADAAEEALKAAVASGAPREWPGGLSQREVEVLRLVAAGLTNGEVADRLFLSRRTVDAHMRRIYDKLSLASRLEAIRYATQHGLA
ncbi:MAG TPA: tetratricopeptide repeat protein [Thermomicrobiales bacterium]|nr:tetratricopeptide repeat protein [Thermomicrobiales bacterium]